MKRILISAVLMAVVSWGAGAAFAQNAVCELKPTQGNHVTGKIQFFQKKGFVLVKAKIEGLTPGKHGFHIHESGDCSAPDASSAKGHFNPGMHHHGGPYASERHAGDLGNLKANAKGVAEYERKYKTMRLSGDNSVVGKAVIVHEKEDDFKTQPTGNAGARVACGVIQEQTETKK